LVLNGGDIYSLYLDGVIDTDGYTLIQNPNLTWTVLDELNNPVYIPAEGGNICIYTSPVITNPINYVYNNDVRGYVKDITIKNISVSNNDKHVTYALTCVITEGEPYLVSIGDRYVWSRDEFVDDETFTRIPPTNLESLKITNADSLLTWTDSTDSANSFILRIRKDGSNLPSDIYYIDNIVLSPVINYRTGNRDATDGSVYEYTLQFSSVGLIPGEWRWSLSSVFDDLRKDFSMWSDESLLIIK
jgi:hypothetical protein